VGGFSVQAHGSKDAVNNCDAVQLQVPSRYWREAPTPMMVVNPDLPVPENPLKERPPIAEWGAGPARGVPRLGSRESHRIAT
jgi:hypothetical protein